MYLLTNCAACAAPLALDAPVCVRCRTRYCDANCQQDHWRRGHKQICKKIHRRGGAERYYADKKYKEAVAEAVEAPKFSTAEEAAVRYAIEQLSFSASSLQIQEFAESCLGAPRGALDAKKAAIDHLWHKAKGG